MTKILILEDDSALHQRIAQAFAQGGYSVQELEGALATLARAFARPAPPVSLGLALRGLMADMSFIDECWEPGENHPDGWYRKFSSSRADDANFNLNTRYRAQRTFKPRQIPVLAFRVNNNNNARSLSSHRSPV